MWGWGYNDVLKESELKNEKYTFSPKNNNYNVKMNNNERRNKTIELLNAISQILKMKKIIKIICYYHLTNIL